MTDQRGAYEKYSVSRHDGKPAGTNGSENWVLETKDPLATLPLLIWADIVEAEGNTDLADAVRESVARAFPGGAE